ncbi:cytochrome P450 [Pyrenophora tritici-repentis]|nr:cytochrome P450 [Pyrenophora tritici-repentis]
MHTGVVYFRTALSSWSWPALCAALTGVFIIYLVYRIEVHPRLFNPFRHLPTAKNGLPFLGHGLLQFTNPRGEAYLEMANSIPNQGLIHFHGFMNVHHLLLVSNEALSEVLVRRAYAFTKPAVARRLLSQILGQSLLILEGDEHRYLRKRIQPAFNYRNVQDLCPIFWSKAVDMVETIEQSAASADVPDFVVDVLPWGNKGTLDAIGLAALGKDLDTLRKPNELIDLYELVTGSKESVRLLFIANAFLPAWLLRFLPRKFNDDINDARIRLRQLCSTFVAERKKEALEDDSSKAILLQLIQSGTLTDDELIDQLLTIIGAGYEPTSATFTWTLWLLATQPIWQARLRAELRAHIPHRFFLNDAQRFSDSATLDTLPVLNAIINETLRFMPTSPITSRIATQDTTILSNHIPAGTRLWIAPAAMNRFTSFYGATADAFDPGRWIDADSGRANNHGDAQTNYAFLTFLHGPRKCIGAGYAKVKLRAFVAAFVGSFEFELADAEYVPVPGGITAIKPRDGLPLRLRRAKMW